MRTTLWLTAQKPGFFEKAGFYLRLGTLIVVALVVGTSATAESACADDAQPVILLTGFEPFGAGRPPNSSWEGIQDLDGREIDGHLIVCRELPVAWGAPLEQLPTWIAEQEPVAVFSFGQGAPGAFAIETRAANSRGRIRDNDGGFPPATTIVAGGPDTLEASIDAASLQQSLTSLGHRVRISTNAGRYLCEECLYSLEHIRRSDHPGLDVMFCHVPPLNTEIDGRRVSAEFVQTFVVDVVETWIALAGPATAAETDTRQSDVEEFIHEYFRTWSDRDLDAYGGCFAANACVQHIDARGRISLYAREPFLDLQEEVHRRSRAPLRETPESIDVRFERELARVVVYWKLTAGNRSEFGYDHFTLREDDGEWQIVNLIFYSTPANEN